MLIVTRKISITSGDFKSDYLIWSNSWVALSSCLVSKDPAYM